MSSEARHTPGPWTWIRAEDDYEALCDWMGRRVVDAPLPVSLSKTDARLIAAAPELLEACKELVSVFTGIVNGIEPDEGLQFLEFADAAIAKAEGRE